MDRRFVLAVVLMMVVLVVPSLFIRRQPPARQPAADTSRVVRPPQPPGEIVAAPPAAPPVTDTTAVTAEPVAVDTVVVESSLYRYTFSTRGARMIGATLRSYRSMRPDERDEPARLLPDTNDFLELAVLSGRDTIRLASRTFEPSTKSLEVTGPATLTFTSPSATGDTARITYRFLPDEYRIGVSGSATGVGPDGGTLLLSLGPGPRNTESDSVEHARELGIVTKDTRSEITRFADLDIGQPRTLSGPFEWVAIKSKYFATALLALDTARVGHGGIGGVQATATDRAHKTPLEASIQASLTVPATGDFGFDLYVGPMEYPRLRAIGHDFDDINPYGWAWLRPIIRPVAIGARWLLVWFHEQLGLAYGLGLVLFGVLIRVVLWPLNQKAMRAGMQMQAIQPLLKEVQERYKNEPQRMQQETFKLYREHKVNPLSGCWPLLLPWPILIALFFVFQNSIELRGASFLWLPDLSRPDPTFIIPVLMGLSMFAVTKVGQMGLPPNPQMKMMLYVMPIMMVVFFFGLASGLNLYYATVNVASIPQQWLVAKERLKAAPPAAPAPPAQKARRQRVKP